MSEWSCYNCGKIFRSRHQFREDEQPLCLECKAKLELIEAQKGVHEAQKEYLELKKKKLQEQP
jgi:DNA-directed RNA polymerase subunit RPC12/RpoP